MRKDYAREIVASKLRREMNRRGWLQKELAADMGMALSQMNRYLNKNLDVGIRTAKRLADYLGDSSLLVEMGFVDRADQEGYSEKNFKIPITGKIIASADSANFVEDSPGLGSETIPGTWVPRGIEVEDLFCLISSAGDFLAARGFHSDNVALIERIDSTSKVIDDSLVIVRIDGKDSLRVCQVADEHLLLHSVRSKKFPTTILHEKRGDKIVGRVIKIVSSMIYRDGKPIGRIAQDFAI